MQPTSTFLSAGASVRVFMVFALVYILSTMVRAVTATLAPELTATFALSASELGLLAGSYFVGFCLMQIPLGICLDRFGPPRTAAVFLAVALVGSVCVATAQSFVGILVGRTLLGLGLAAGLMAPLTAYRRWYAPATLVRASAWMQMVGALGMLLSTLPVQWLLPLWGWRGVFWVWAAIGCVALVGLLLGLPRWENARASSTQKPPSAWEILKGYGTIVRDRRFISVVPLGFCCYGSLFAILTLWAGPWLQNVAGQTPQQAASGLLAINVLMMCAFLLWGWAAPKLERAGMTLEQLALRAVSLGLLILPVVVWRGSAAGWPYWAAYCLSITAFSMVQPKLAQGFPSHLAGRTLTAFNLAIFSGTFFMQWTIGVAIDAFLAAGFDTVGAYQNAMWLLWGVNVAALGWFLRFRVPAASLAQAA
ncbi:MFS transporter [Lampropedia puyangensis]|uniref:MFS transporter n=1 Tax=Lampropedia puyangensis TaxID=1330072 RepID=A0A4S8F1W9_9BURK|nr:MFS transporter [Lampropedia puyangensis]THU00671.1 MFS transporter [Lampropedia puyangensis]